MDPLSKRRIALFDFNRDHNSITNDEWVAWFKSAFEEDLQDLDVLKQRLQRAIRFDTKILDAESRVGRMLDGLIRSLEQDHQEWVLHQEGKMVVEVMTKSIKPESPKTAVQKQLQLQRNCSYVEKRRLSEAGRSSTSLMCQDVTAAGKTPPRTMAESAERPKRSCPRMPEPSAKKGCLKCSYMSHRVARCPKTAPGEAETLLAAQVKRWKDGIKVLVNQPQRQKTERGVLLENLGLCDAKPVVMTRSVKFNCVTLDKTCGPLVLRGLKAWVDDASTATELIKKEELDASSVLMNELSGTANVKRLMVEQLNPPELYPDDGMECATRRFIPKPLSKTKRNGAARSMPQFKPF
ncbi:hypothetical protein DYB31_007032 [Aphanomyces astaci]|uniref:Uncharacterized protein n=1 Tax=Aphanomyces astaci TaxID=112090 RepID=A0A397F0V0_APHAT|nr:hypothetical protein DYB31_007032 [Aphanomyces astaci]